MARFRPGPRKVIALLAGLGLVAGLGGGIAKSATTVSPLNPGSPEFTREPNVNITVNPVAVQFNRNLAGNFVRVSPLSATCVGDDQAGTNNSPRTIVEVIGPGTTGVVFKKVSPVLRRDITGAFTGYPELNPQPAPNATNYRGGAHGSTVSGHPTAGNTTRPWTLSASLEGQPGGIYTVRTTTQNMVRPGPITSPGACTVGTPAQTSATTFGTTFTAGAVVEERTFEYRPWQHIFTDVLGNGRVNLNMTPREFQAVVANQSGTIYPGGPYISHFAVTASDIGADPTAFMLPSDPAGCADDPSSCLPPTATPCDPATGCVVRLVVINKRHPGDRVQGIFDLQTKAFIASVGVNGYQRILFSLGTEQDAAYHDLLNQLAAQASAQGVDLINILATKIRARTGTQEFSLSLLNGLQIDPTAAPAGVQLVSDATVQAGLILNIYAGLGGSCPTPASGDSNPDTPAPDRYTHTSDVGYTVEKSDLLPEVPRAGAVGALVGGPIYHIEGDFVGEAPALVNTSMAIIGADTAADEPNGYPVWVQPFVSGIHIAAPRTMDFLGTATWSASETNLGALGCLTVDFMLGAGVAIYNNPLDLGFGDLPIWDPRSPEVQNLMAQINAAVQGAVDEVATNPTVADLLDQITEAVLGGALPTDDLPVEVPAVPAP